MMIIILSPSKTMELSQMVPLYHLSTPRFQKEASKLMKVLKKEKVVDLEKGMKLSLDLAKKVKSWHKEWGNSLDFYLAGNSMMGEAFKALEFNTISEIGSELARNRLFILSGLYGALSPFDIIQPYRLEMAQKFSPYDGSKSLNVFWSKRLPQYFNEISNEVKTNFIANLASDEYNKVVLRQDLELQVVNFNFKVETEKGLKNISVFAKQARGAMARYILENQIKTVDELKGFNCLGFKFREDLSTTLNLTFTRTR